MDSPSFDFQSGSFGSYGDDLLMMGGDSGFDFGNVEWEQFDFDALPGLEAEVELEPEQLVDQCTPGLSPDTSLKVLISTILFVLFLPLSLSSYR